MMQKKNLVISVLALAVVIGLASSGFIFGLTVGRNIPQKIVIEGGDGFQTEAANFGTFWEAWQRINDSYLKAGEVEDGKKVRGAIAGLVDSLDDPYSEYFTPEGAKSFKEDVEGTFSGIGAEIGLREEKLLVIAPLKGTPAERAGLRPNDQILFINSTSTEGMGVDKAITFIRGKQGTPVTLTILREGFEEPKEFKIVRDSISVPTLEYKMLPGSIAHIQLYSFNSNADRLFWDAVRRAANSGARGVILDMRGNPGGYLEVAVNLAGWFLERGTIVVTEEGREGVIETERADGNEALVDTPVVILIDKGSASASEILAGALRDQRKIKLVGETTFGKGTVQQFMDLSDGSVIKLTIAHWVLPSGKILEGDGLVPDFEVKLTEEDFKNNKDPQLDKAIEVLKSEMN